MARIRTIKPEFWREEVVSSSLPHCTVYCIAEQGSEKDGPCKVGIATNLYTRMASLQCGNWRPINLIWGLRVLDRDDAKRIEQELLMQFRPNPYDGGVNRLMSEWVAARPAQVLEHAIVFARLHLTIVEAI